MWLLGVPATIMSLGGIGIALGMAVDADVVALEACHRRLEGEGDRRVRRASGARRSLAAAGSFAPAILTSLLITALSFLPVFAFTGETGRLLRPLAITKTLVIAAAALVALTLAPALRDRLLRGRVVPEFDNPLTRRLVRIYRPFVHFALRRPVLTLVTAALAVVSCLPIVTRLGGEFLPRLDEGDLLFMPTTAPGVSAGEAGVQLRQAGPRDQRASTRWRRCSARSAARRARPIPRRSRWPRRPSGCGRAPNGPSSRSTRWYLELGAGRAQAGARPRLARIDDADDRRAGRRGSTARPRCRAGRTPGPRRRARAWT